MKTINKIRSKDPSIYNTDKEWFAEEGSASGVSNGKEVSGGITFVYTFRLVSGDVRE